VDEMGHRHVTRTGEKIMKDEGKKKLGKRRRRQLGVVIMRWILKKQDEINEIMYIWFL
jgi:hypothetical protein